MAADHADLSLEQPQQGELVVGQVDCCDRDRVLMVLYSKGPDGKDRRDDGGGQRKNPDRQAPDVHGERPVDVRRDHHGRGGGGAHSRGKDGGIARLIRTCSQQRAVGQVKTKTLLEPSARHIVKTVSLSHLGQLGAGGGFREAITEAESTPEAALGRQVSGRVEG